MTQHEHPQTDDNVTIKIFDAAKAPTPSAAKNAEPIRTYRTHNTTRVRYHETIIEALNGGTSPDLAVDAAAFGGSSADTSTLAPSSPLGNELFRTTPTDQFVIGQEFNASIFIDSTEANGLTLEEFALVSEQSNGSDLPINRLLIQDPGGLLAPKSNNETVTFDVTLTQQDA